MITPSFGPKQTPRSLKGLLWVLFLGAILSSIFLPAMGILSLSLPGIAHGFFWQLVTYPFAASSPLSFGMVIGLTFVLYLTWAIGGLLIKRVGAAPFLRFFFISAALIGLFTLLCTLSLNSTRPLAGLTPVLYALLIAMICFGADSNLLLFMMVPFRAKTLVLSLMAFNVILDLAAREWTYAIADLLGAATGYLYALLVWDLRSPFLILRPLDAAIALLGRSFRRMVKLGEPGYGKKSVRRSPEQEAEDSAFLEAMLTKISQKGPQSLSLWERWKIKRVTKRKKR